MADPVAMTERLRHRHDTQHRGLVPEDQLAAETPTAGHVVTATGTGEAEWAAPSGGAPDDATYLVGAAHGDLSAEIVVGATPGGELGGTWASPTVDATHSGSTHAATQAAAEATAAAALAGHTGDTTDAHDASAISIVDAGTYFASTEVEGALQEAMAAIVGGGTTITTKDEGSTLSTAVTALDFVGAGVTATGAGATTTVTIPSAAPTTNILVDIATPVQNTAGSITLNGTTWEETAAETGGPGTGVFDLDMTGCAAGDIVHVGASMYLNNAAVYAYFAFATMVAGSPVNWIGARTAATTGDGIQGLAAITGREETKGASQMYTLVSGDLSAGALKLRLYHRTSTATNRTLFGTAANPLNLWAIVYRP